MNLGAQCTISSPCGYNININIRLLNVVPSSMSCPYGYNYNIRFSYNITITGVNTCYNDNIGFQPQIACNGGQNNGYYTINMAAPNVGGSSSSSSISGTLTTSTNPYNSASDCATVTPTSMNCNALKVTVFGPGIPSSDYTCSFSILPVELAYFNATYVNPRVLLTWSTRSERNNDFFTVERSTDGAEWMPTDRVKGAGTTQLITIYESSDEGFSNGINYYRLKQTDYNGDSKYSSIVLVNTLQESDEVRCFPNPANDVLHIQTGSSRIKEFVITNNLNQTLLSGSMDKTAAINLSHLPAGIYFLTLRDEGKQQSFKLVKN